MIVLVQGLTMFAIFISRVFLFFVLILFKSASSDFEVQMQ